MAIMINGVGAQELQMLDQTLARLRSLGKVTEEQLRADWLMRSGIERTLQILVEVVVDICQRLIALNGQSPAVTSAHAISRCVEMGALSNEEHYYQMVRLRNFIVHRYDHIDSSVLAEMLNQHLGDFEQFRDEVVAYVERH